MIDIKKLTQIAKTAALAAGVEIIKVYESVDLGIEYKKDESPLTKADQAAHAIIMDHLKVSQLPVLSEEGRDIPYEERKSWDYFWMVDPLDGTKEFIKRNGEFTVNIALINEGKPVMGVVYAPVLGWLYWGNAEEGAWKQHREDAAMALTKPGVTAVKTIVASRSHLNPETQKFIENYPGAEVISMGSSLKFMLVAENKAQVYPRFAPTMEWDTAAAHGVVDNMGLGLFQQPGNEMLTYNKSNLLNPYFICGWKDQL